MFDIQRSHAKQRGKLMLGSDTPNLNIHITTTLTPNVLRRRTCSRDLEIVSFETRVFTVCDAKKTMVNIVHW
jgi:hypothetical protein